MNCDSKPEWGTRIERGIVTAASGGEYTVNSYDRPELTVSGIKNKSGATIAANDKVVFYVFTDGVGAILHKLG